MGGCCSQLGWLCARAYADAGSTVIAGTSLGLSAGTTSTSAAAKVLSLVTSSGGDGLWLRCRPRIDGEAAVVIVICCCSHVGVVSGIGDLTRRLPGIMEGVAADNDDDPVE